MARFNPEDTFLLRQLSGRPPKLSKEQQLAAAKAFLDYIDFVDDPIIPDFLANDSVAKGMWLEESNLTTYPIFHRLVKKALKKQESYVLRKGMNGQSTAMSIFRLKQRAFGYADRFDTDITSNGEKITFVNSVPRPQLKGKSNSKASSK